MISTDMNIAIILNTRGGMAAEKIKPKRPMLMRMPTTKAKNSQTIS
jgi:hypothetical protein